jgi:single-strand DNA-binding protein
MKNITIAGRIGKDAETRNTQQGDQVTSFTVAVDEGFGDKKRTLWFDCSLWGKRGEKLSGYITKGSSVTVTGDLSTREYEGKTYLTIRANDLTLQGGRDAGGRQDRVESSNGDQSQFSSGSVGGGRTINDDIDEPIPF